MGLFGNIGGFIKKKVFKPVEKAVLKPVKEAVIDPVAEHVVDPVVSAVDDHIVKPVGEHVVAPAVDAVDQHVVKPVGEHVVDPTIKAVGEHVVKPVGKHVVEPVVGAVGDYLVDPIAEHIVNPVREKVDYDFAVKDELKAYETALAQFRAAYAVFAEDRSTYLTARMEYEKLSEEFTQNNRGHGGIAIVGPSHGAESFPDRLRDDKTFIEFFEPQSLLDLVTGRKFINYFENIEDHQAILDRAAKSIRDATHHVQSQSDTARNETAVLVAKSAALRAEFGEGGSVSTQLLEETKTNAQRDLVQSLVEQGLDAETIAEITGWSADFITNALQYSAAATEA